MREEVYVESAVAPQRSFLGRISWGAVIAGVFVTLVIGLILSLLGIGIGASTINPLTEQQPFKHLGIGAMIWLALTGLVSSFFGAWVAGRSSGDRQGDGYMHGLVTWGVTTICMGLLATTALGSLLGGAAALFGQTLSATAKTGSAAMSQGGESKANWDGIKKEISAKFPQTKAILSPTGPTSGQPADANSPTQGQQNPELLAALTKMFANGGAAAAPAEREQAINLIASQQNVSREEAAKTVDGWDQKYQQAKAETEQKAREAGDAAARGVSRFALGSFFLLVLFGIAAVFGGRTGESSALRHVTLRTQAAT